MGIVLLIIWPFYIAAWIAYEVNCSERDNRNSEVNAWSISLTFVGVILFVLSISVFTSTVYA